MRICIVGPVSPIRGGIARHTTALARECAGREDISLKVISFSRQYPGVLYPGQNQHDPDAPDLSQEGIDATAMIDSINPLSWRRAARAIRDFAPDLVVMPAWTFFLAPCLGWIARGLDMPVVMIVHNAVDHEATRWKTALSRFQLCQADTLVTHNAGLRDALAGLVPDTPITIRPHPVYDDYPAATGALPREAGLELLFFGLVRRYKGLDLALRALAESGLEDVRLSVVGEFWHGRAETEALIAELGLGDRVELTPKYVSDQEAAEAFERADWVIAPYYSASGSGVIALAQWYLRPVIASDIPGLADAISDGATGHLFPAADQGALAALLKARITRDAAEAMTGAMQAMRADLSWEHFADAVIDAAPAPKS